MRFSEAKGHAVMSTTEAVKVGKLAKLVVDPVSRAVIALKLKKTPDKADLVAWHDLTAFGRDVATVQSAALIGDGHGGDGRIAALADKRHDIIGKRLLDTSGVSHGEVKDFDFDLDSGLVTMLLTKSSEVPGERMIGLGSWALVVRT